MAKYRVTTGHIGPIADGRDKKREKGGKRQRHIYDDQAVIDASAVKESLGSPPY